jgi:hypothetical protein
MTVGDVSMRVEVLTFSVPVRTYSITNLRGHWGKKSGPAKLQRDTTWRAWLGAGGRKLSADETAAVRLTRIAPRALDAADNLPASCKSVRDQIAACLGIDDRSPRVTWTYDQRRGRPREYSVEVEIRFGT